MEVELHLFQQSQKMLRNKKFMFFCRFILISSIIASYLKKSQFYFMYFQIFKGIFFIAIMVLCNIMQKSMQPCFKESYKTWIYKKSFFFL